VTSLRGDASSREPLLWVQLLGLAAWPLEALGLLLLLAGGDPGPFPLLERLFCWGLGAVLPAVFFWRLPPDPSSLLLVQVPLRGRRDQQRCLSALNANWVLRVGAAAGTLPLLALVWWADRQGGIAWSLSPLAATPRLLVLLTCSPLLALMLWQWHQFGQAIWLLTRPASLLDAPMPLGLEQAPGQRLNLGLPLLLVPPLNWRPSAENQRVQPRQPNQTAPDPDLELDLELELELDLDQPDPTAPLEGPGPADPNPASGPLHGQAEAQAELEPDPSAAPLARSDTAPEGITFAPSVAIETAAPRDRAVVTPMAIDQQQPPEDGQGNDLNQQV
jgi:hypothetical protein